jgi:glutathione peroxidase
MALLVMFGFSGCLKGATVQMEPPTQQSVHQAQSKAETAQGIHRHEVRNAYGQKVALKELKGQPVLIVNTASRCGYTSQYDGLQKLHVRYAKQGLRIIGFPANDFGSQEPGTNKEIQDFCRANYGVTFPVYAKIKVHGPDKHDLYKSLTEESAESFRGEVRWNFEKFLVDDQGRVVGRFQSGISPDDRRLTDAIETLLR